MKRDYIPRAVNALNLRRMKTLLAHNEKEVRRLQRVLRETCEDDTRLRAAIRKMEAER